MEELLTIDPSDWHGFPFGRGHSLMIEAYFDESEKAGRKPLLILAGYLAEDDKWREFSSLWGETLRANKLPYFHMKHFGNSGSKLFNHLSRSQRVALLDRCIELVKQCAVLGMIVYFNPSDYQSVTDRKFRSWHGSPYGFLVNLMLGHLDLVLINPTKFPERINVYLEDGHKNAMDGIKQIKEWKEITDPVPDEIDGDKVLKNIPYPERESVLRIGSYGLGSKTGMLALHPSDILAHLTNKTICRNSSKLLDRKFDELLESVPHISICYGRSDLVEIVGAIKQSDIYKAGVRSSVYEAKKSLRMVGFRVQEKPWGMTIDGEHLTEEEWLRAVEEVNRIVEEEKE